MERVFTGEQRIARRLNVDSALVRDKKGKRISVGDTVTYTLVRTGATGPDVFEGCTVGALCADGRVKILHPHFATGYKIVSPVALEKTS